MPPRPHQTSRRRPPAPTRGRRRTTSPTALIAIGGLVVAAIAGGAFLTSRRGGESAAAVVALSWAPGGTLWAVDRAGGSHRSTDGGATWQAAGRVDGQPQALLATDDRLVIAVATPGERTAIYQSVDAGRSWQARYQSPG